MSPFQATLQVVDELNPGLPEDEAVCRAARAAEFLWDRGFVLVSARRHLAVRLIPWLLTGIVAIIGLITGPVIAF